MASHARGGPLAGLLVVSLEQAVAAPMASCRLADAGARVIKIERSEGDFARDYDQAAKGGSSYFTWLNRGKESLVLDIKSPDDATLLHQLLARADVFIQNLAAGAAERAGFGAQTLRARNPQLITCSISGYGEEGPYAQMKAYDLLVQAESGLLSVSGPAGNPGRVGISVCDIATGVSAALAIHEALWRRAQTGHGESISLSLFDVIAEWMTVPLLFQDHLGAAPANIGLAHPSIAPYGAFTSADGQTLIISIQNDREWRDFAAAILDDETLGLDARFATNLARVRNRSALEALIVQRFAMVPFAALTTLLRDARIAYGAVNDVAGLAAHPQLQRIEVSTEFGAIRLPAPPASDSHRDEWGSVPALGEHSERIRQEFGAI